MEKGVPEEEVGVYRVDPASSRNRLVWAVAVWARGARGTENTSVGMGFTVIASSTAGYNFMNPTGPVPLPGGLARIDVRQDQAGCGVVWADSLPSDAVPKLSVRGGNLYTFGRTGAGSPAPQRFDVIDARTRPALTDHTAG